ncbi:MAG: DUF4290 domain-containing protein [Bacteroidales bacterium]
MEYNTQLKRMVLPEYGRNVQSMVDHALTIEDRAERARCAQSIINIMGNLFPHLRDVEDFKHKLWDHLAIMSDFKLDIDYPYEIIRKENLYTHPEKVAYSLPKIRYRHYGKFLEQMLEKARQMEDTPERRQLLLMLAHQMKRSCLNISREGEVDDEKIYKDISEYTQGDIALDAQTLRLKNSRDILQRKNKNMIRRAVR